jgi:hypothetical protein
LWRGAQTIAQWWSTPKVQFEDNPANQLQVTIKPAGRAQVAAWFQGFRALMNEQAGRAGGIIGVSLAEAIFGSSSKRIRANKGQAIADFVFVYSGLWVFEAGSNLAKNLWTGFTGRMRELGKGFTDLFREILNAYNPFDAGRRLGGQLLEGAKAAVRRGTPSISNTITRSVRDAIQSSRSALAGAAGSLGGLVAEIIGGTSPEAKRAREIRAQQKREADAREEARLREAIAQAESDDERRLAQRDLDDFLLDQEAQRLEESVAQQQTAAQKSIADLTESFNQGSISADQFSASLNAIIGGNRGEELGAAFAGAFNRELETILNTARDIFAVIGTGGKLAAGAGTEVSDTLRSENQRRFKAAHDDWKKNKKSRNAELKDLLEIPENKRTNKQKDRIIRLRELLKEPKREAYGLALGGVLNKQVFTAGEAGPEAVMPLTGRGGDMLRDALGLGNRGGAQVINLTVNAGLGTNPDELSRVIVDSIKRYERRNGQVFSGPLVSSTATASGIQSTDAGQATFLRAARRG